MEQKKVHCWRWRRRHFLFEAGDARSNLWRASCLVSFLSTHSSCQNGHEWAWRTYNHEQNGQYYTPKALGGTSFEDCPTVGQRSGLRDGCRSAICRLLVYISGAELLLLSSGLSGQIPS